MRENTNTDTYCAIISFNESPLKNDSFYFILKALFFLKIFNFFTIYGHEEKIDWL